MAAPPPNPVTPLQYSLEPGNWVCYGVAVYLHLFITGMHLGNHHYGQDAELFHCLKDRPPAPPS